MIIIYNNAHAAVDSAKSFIVMNADTKEIISEKNAYERLPMASTTKIMTLLCALKNSNSQDVVRVNKTATLEEGSSAYLKPNADITMLDLMHGLMLNSGNDAAVAIAYHISGSNEGFSELMTAEAKEIGAINTQFKNPNGLEAEGHYTTAYDLALITQYALTIPEFVEIVSKRSYKGTMKLPDGTEEVVEYINHNRLLREVKGCVGVKTGFTKVAGRCLVSAIEYEGSRYIVVTLNDSDDWNTHKTLYKDAIDNHTFKNLVKKGDVLKYIDCDGVVCNIIAQCDYGVYVDARKQHNFELITKMPESIDFSLNKDERVGSVIICLDGTAIAEIPLIADRDMAYGNESISRRSFSFILNTILRNII